MIFVFWAILFKILVGSFTAKYFGASAELDAFLMALTVPTFLMGLISSGTSFTLLPMLTEARHKSAGSELSLVSSVLCSTLLINTQLSILGVLAASSICRILAPGFSETQLALTTHLFQFLLPAFLISSVSEIISCQYYVVGKFFLPSFVRALSVVILFLVVFLFWRTLGIYSLVLGNIFAAILSPVILFVGLGKALRSEFNLKNVFQHPELRIFFRLNIPLFAGMFIYKAIPLFDRWLGSKLAEGSISILGYANRLYEIPQFIFISGLTTSLFPVIAAHANKNETASANRLFEKSIRFVFFLFIPIAIFLGISGQHLVRVLFEHGRFNASDAQLTSQVLSLYMIGLPACAIGGIIGQGYYIKKDILTCTITNIGAAFLYGGTCLFLLPRFQILAFPIAQSIYFIFTILLDSFIIQRKHDFKLFNFAIASLWGPLIALIPCIPLLIVINIFLSSHPILACACMAFNFLIYLLIQYFVLKSAELKNLIDFLKSQRPLSMLRNRLP
ncbi:MAG: mviN1 [Bacteriovoracaceae bacterium]|nr:mviN1 [Bacteriovoracaceae bacterium]